MKIRTYEECHKGINGELYKTCSCHKDYFPNENDWFPCNDEYFYKNNKSLDGLFPYCKKCNSLKASKWGKDHPERKSQNNKISKANNNNYYNKKDTKKYRESGKLKQWQQNNKDKIKQYTQNREQHKKHDISKKEWEACKQYFNNCCAYCGLPIEEHYNKFKGKIRLTDFHKEHIDHEGANDLSNCVPSCKECNSSKNVKTLNEWYNKDNINFKQERLDKIHKWINEDYKLVKTLSNNFI